MSAPADTGRTSAEQALGPPKTSGAGADLRHAREQRGLSLDELSRRTKISLKILESLEANQLDKLPEPIFVRGFLRAYAREVGLNPEETVQRYLTQFPPRGEAAERATATPSPFEPGGAVERETDVLAAGTRDWRARGVLIAALVVIAGYAMIHWRASGPSQPVPAAAPATVAPHPEVGTSGSNTSAPIATATDVLKLTVHVRGLCWVSATVDGSQVVHRLMPAGETYSVGVHEDAVLRVGDPAAFTFTINGAEGRSLGAEGEPVTVRITKQNYREFLAGTASRVTAR